MTDDTEVDGPLGQVEQKIGNHRLPSNLIAVTAIALSAAALIWLTIDRFGEAFSRGDRNTETAGDACMRDNQLRREVNRQAEAFVHHNDETLRWAIVVRRTIDRSSPPGEDAFQATNRLVKEYRKVRDEYFTLPLLDCSDPDRGRLSPSRPVAP